MASEFKARFLGEHAELEGHSIPCKKGTSIGVTYVRYSDDSSNPRSLDQQLGLILERARKDNVYNPWRNVFADAAVTGTVAARTGYTLAKAAIQAPEASCLYIDEIGRASRYAIESLRLGRLVADTLRKRLVGVSDGFDSESPQSKLVLSVYAMLQEWYSDQLRIKVKRGQKDAFQQGGNLHSPPFGYKLVPKRDGAGNPIQDHNGKTRHTIEIDKEAAAWVKELFRLYTEEKWSLLKIGRYFNEQAVDGKHTWTATKVKQLLTRETYMGVQVRGMTSMLRDPETGNIRVIHHPEEEWIRREAPHLRIISEELWEKTKERLKACRLIIRKGQRSRAPKSELYPTTLLRPVCGCCGHELYLGRSGKYPSYHCPNGVNGSHGCTMRSYKAVRIVEDAVLSHIRDQVLCTEFLDKVLTETNEQRAAYARKPPVDPAPLRAKIKKAEKTAERLSSIIEEHGDEDLGSLVERLKRHEAELKELRAQLREAETRKAKPVRRLTLEEFEPLMEDLRDLLNDDVAKAAPILRSLTGPILVTEAPWIKSARGTPWLAEFSVNMMPVLAELSAGRNCPTTDISDLLNAHTWTSAVKVKLLIRFRPKFEKVAEEVVKMVKQGVSVTAVAKAFGLSGTDAKRAIEYAHTGECPVDGAGARIWAGQVVPELLAVGPLGKLEGGAWPSCRHADSSF
jgi:DNA invertase Pin-like site-specific DNA recombinase